MRSILQPQRSPLDRVMDATVEPWRVARGEIAHKSLHTVIAGSTRNPDMSPPATALDRIPALAGIAGMLLETQSKTPQQMKQNASRRWWASLGSGPGDTHHKDNRLHSSIDSKPAGIASLNPPCSASSFNPAERIDLPFDFMINPRPMTTTIIDITPAVSGETPVFPGDTAFAATRSWAIGEDCPVNVSKLVMSTHTGAHADAPLHYAAEGRPIDEVDVAAYIGPCALVHLTDAGPAIGREALRAALDAIHVTAPERVLIRTYERLPETWDENFTAVGADAIEWLSSQGCRLIGVDTPSLDPAASKTMDAHKAVWRADMRVLEGLKLDHAAPGVYELIAPPLKLKGLDAAPVRALLRTLP